MGFGWILITLHHALLTYFTIFSLSVNGQAQYAVEPVEANSSPSNITATKGSSVWLHWNYTYIGDGPSGSFTLDYKEQIIGFYSTSNSIVQVLARRIGQNGALRLESPVPAPFRERVEVISSNSTLVIHDLQYNDSTYHFSSYVTVYAHFVGSTPKENKFELKPCVSITTTATTRCKNKFVFCGVLRSYCSHVWVLLNCKKACGKCPKPTPKPTPKLTPKPTPRPTCQDKRKNCAYWNIAVYLVTSYCRGGPFEGFMRRYCQKSCGFCWK